MRRSLASQCDCLARGEGEGGIDWWMASVAVDNRLDHRETEPAAGRGGPGGIHLVEAIEEERDVLRRNAAARITDGQQDFGSIQLGMQLDAAAALQMHADINIGVGTALGNQGLIVPVLHRAQDLNLMGIAQRLAVLVNAARASKLAPADVRGGTFTISNHGVGGSLLAAPIVINQPQVAILGVGKAQRRVCVIDANGSEVITYAARNGPCKGRSLSGATRRTSAASSRPCCSANSTVDRG